MYKLIPEFRHLILRTRNNFVSRRRIFFLSDFLCTEYKKEMVFAACQASRIFLVRNFKSRESVVESAYMYEYKKININGLVETLDYPAGWQNWACK